MADAAACSTVLGRVTRCWVHTAAMSVTACISCHSSCRPESQGFAHLADFLCVLEPGKMVHRPASCTPGAAPPWGSVGSCIDCTVHAALRPCHPFTPASTASPHGPTKLCVQPCAAFSAAGRPGQRGVHVPVHCQGVLWPGNRRCQGGELQAGRGHTCPGELPACLTQLCLPPLPPHQPAAPALAAVPTHPYTPLPLLPSLQPGEVIETPATGCLHPAYQGYFGSPAEYMRWYEREGPVRDPSAPTGEYTERLHAHFWGTALFLCCRAGQLGEGLRRLWSVLCAALLMLSPNPTHCCPMCLPCPSRRSAVPQARHHRAAGRIRIGCSLFCCSRVQQPGNAEFAISASSFALPSLQYIAQLIETMEAQGLRPLPIFINGVEAHTVVG